MPPLVYEDNIKVQFVAGGVTDPEAPSVAGDLGAAVDLESYIPKNGIQFPGGRGSVDTGAIDSTFNSTYPGSRSGVLTITLKRKNRDGNEVAWTTFKDGLVAGDILIGYEGTIAEADEVDVYRGTAHFPVRANPQGDTEQRFTIEFHLDDEYQAVTVAA